MEYELDLMMNMKKSKMASDRRSLMFITKGIKYYRAVSTLNLYLFVGPSQARPD